MKKKESRIRIKAYSYDYALLDKAIKDIVEIVKRTGAEVSGPIPLPTKIERFTVLRSTNTDKRSREQFEIRTYKRLLDIYNATNRTVDSIQNYPLPSGIEIKVQLI
ncbi:MAG: 30S ribosomal protein S10 [Planctomycetota bacterium]